MLASGTIAGTGTTTAVPGLKFNIAMDFAGTASVDVERYIPTAGAWIKVVTAVTADYDAVREYASPVILRLNCTAHTNNVKWEIESVAT